MRSVILSLASLVAALPASAQEPDAAQLVDYSLEVCATPTGPASFEQLQARLGSNLKNFAVFCASYAEAWKKGFDTGTARDKAQSYDAFCRSAIEKVAAGQQSYAPDLERNYPDMIERAVVAGRCELYRQAYTAGLEKARNMVAR